MKKILYLLFLMLSQKVCGQIDLSGEWEGKAIQPHVGWDFKVSFEHKGNQIVGGTYYEDENNPGHYAAYKVKGKFSNNVLSYEEYEIVKEQKISTSNWCYVICNFDYYEKGDSMFLVCKRARSWTAAKTECPLADCILKKKKTVKVKTETELPSEVKLNEKITLKNIQFPANKHEVMPSSYPELNSLADFLKAHPSVKIQIIGHTDKGSTPTFNQALSEGRANAVMNYLINNGVQKHRLSAIGKGGTMPVADNNTVEGRQKNRRVEIVITAE